MSRYRHGWRPYVPVAKRRRKTAKTIAAVMKVGQEVEPVEIEGRRIAATFWGQAWCDNLEAYSDFANRLPRGRTYVRNGSVVHLSVETGRVQALVMGTDLYRVDIGIEPLPERRWTEVKGRSAGEIDSLVELLRGSLSKGVMEVVTRPGEGLFPSPGEIALSCSCPDWAVMCKHVAAALYGVGARLDHEPEKLFTLRGVDPVEMVEAAVRQPPGAGAPRGRVLASDDLSSVFGIEIDTAAEDPDPAAGELTKRKAAGRKASKEKAGGKKAASRKKVAGKKAVLKKQAAGKKAVAKKKVAGKKAGSKKRAALTKAPLKKKATVKKAASKKKAVGKKAALKKAALKKKTAGKKAALKKKVAAKKTASKKKVAGKKAALKRKVAVTKAASKKAAGKKAASRKATPKKKKAASKRKIIGNRAAKK